MNNYAPVVFIGFNRPYLSIRSMNNVAQCLDVDKRDCYLFIDGPWRGRADDVEKTEETYKVAEELKRTKLPRLTIIRREKNYGCRKNIIAAISEIVNKHGRCAIVEDDVLVSKTFLSYIDSALETYKEDKRIWCINAYQNPNLVLPRSLNVDVYLSPRNMCWGWGVWADRWNAVDFEMTDWPEFIKIPGNDERVHKCGVGLEAGIWDQYRTQSSWDTECTYHMIKNNLFAVEPRRSLTKNCGSGVDGTHSLWQNDQLTKQKYYNFAPVLPAALKVDAELLDNYRFICNARPSSLRIAVRKLLGKFSFKDEEVPSLWSRIISKLKKTVLGLSVFPVNDEPIEI